MWQNMPGVKTITFSMLGEPSLEIYNVLCNRILHWYKKSCVLTTALYTHDTLTASW